MSLTATDAGSDLSPSVNVEKLEQVGMVNEVHLRNPSTNCQPTVPTVSCEQTCNDHSSSSSKQGLHTHAHSLLAS